MIAPRTKDLLPEWHSSVYLSAIFTIAARLYTPGADPRTAIEQAIIFVDAWLAIFPELVQ